jgi:hypothetical protein
MHVVLEKILSENHKYLFGLLEFSDLFFDESNILFRIMGIFYFVLI